MVNPYLKRGGNFSLMAEAKRLFGGGRFILTLLLIVIPLIVGIGGAVDFGTKTMYDMNSRGAKDTRKLVWQGDCLMKSPDKARLCADKTGTVRVLLWPFVPDPSFFYTLPLLLAFMSFVSIGSPRFGEIGKSLFPKKGGKGQVVQLEPFASPSLVGQWVLGAVSQRRWQSDPGYFYQSKSTKAYCLNPAMLRTNLLIVAPPGSGKTSSIFRPLIEYCKSIGACLFVFDSKGDDFDPGLFDLNFDLVNPEGSIKINLFAGDSPAQAGERLGEALIQNLSDDKEYYVNVAKDTMRALVAGHYAIFGQYPELTDLLLYLSAAEKINELAERIKINLGIGYRERERLEAELRRITQLLTNSKKDTLGSLNTALTPLTSSNADLLLVANPSADDPTIYSIEELLTTPRLIRFSLPVADNPRLAPIVGRIISTQFNFAVLSPRSNKEILKLAAIDEAHNFINSSIAKGMAQARSNNGGFLLALQTLSQIEDVSLLDTIFAASGNKLVMAGVGDKDAERFSKTYGELELPYVTKSRSNGKNASTNTGTTNSNTSNTGRSGMNVNFSAGGTSGSTTSRSVSSTSTTSVNTQTKLRRLFLPSEIRQLPKYHAIIESSDAYGNRWSAQMLDMSSGTVGKIQKANPARADKNKAKKDAALVAGQKNSASAPKSGGDMSLNNPLAISATTSKSSGAPLQTTIRKPLLRVSSSEDKAQSSASGEAATKTARNEAALATMTGYTPETCLYDLERETERENEQGAAQFNDYSSFEEDDYDDDEF